MAEKSLKRNSLYNVLYNAANMLFPLITYAYVSHTLLADGIGRVAYGQNIASYFVVLAVMGLPSYGIREVAKVRADRISTNKLVTELLILNALFTSIAVVAYLITILNVQKFQNDYLLFICCGVQIIMCYFNVDWLYRGLEEYKYITVRSIVVKMICLVAVFASVRTKADYLIYALLTSLAVTLNNFFNIIYSKKFISLDFHGLHIKRHLTPLLILALASFLATAYSKIDVTMLGAMATDTAIGLYNNAHKTVDLAITACTAITSVFLPRLSFYYLNERALFNKLLEKGVKVLIFISFPLAAGFAVLAPQMMGILFGESFILAGITVRIFAVLIVVKSLGDLVCYQLSIATGNEKKRLPAYFAAAIINIVFNTILIPRMAQNGAAIASVVSEVTVNGVQLIAMRKIVNINMLGKTLLQGFFTSLAMIITILVLNYLMDYSFLQFVICIVIGAGVYLSLNVLAKNEIALMGLAWIMNTRRIV